MLDLCDAHGIERPEVNVVVEGLEVDFLWRAQRLIVETDGREDHGTPIAFHRDRERDERLTVLGYRVVRVHATAASCDQPGRRRGNAARAAGLRRRR